MFRLSFIICLISIQVFAQSPHGDINLDCSVCHVTDTWKVDVTKLQFDHSSTGYDLTGEHLKIDCRSCHSSLKFKETRTECIDCHTDVHELTLGGDCANCHTPETWIVSNITEIHQENRFPLLGAHYTTDCEKCHVSSSMLKFEPLDIACFSCHSKDYYSTANPNHVQAGFSNDCEQCHSMNSVTWSATDINHQFFPLTAGHAIGDCFACHNQDSFQGLSAQCYSCHSDDYNNVLDPNHIANNFSQSCEECHSTNPGWTPVRFPNHNNFYVLAGAHADISCNDCHADGYDNTPTLCYDCHRDEYTNANNPSHTTLGFSQNCEECHTQNSWVPAAFDHDNEFFPIYSGSHRGEWDNCSDCHTNQSDYSIFTCIDCHEHNQNSMNDEHREVNGYVYESTACFDCHPRGQADDLAFNHAATNFPLIGAHTGLSCNSCHVSPDVLPGTLCIDCHGSDFNQATDPNHSILKFSQDCEECHSSNAGWPLTSFTIHDQFYLLTGGHALIADDCGSCHESGYTNTPDQCIDCHLETFNTAVDPNHVELQLSPNCDECHITNPDWKPALFPVHDQFFQLLGAHSLITDCAECHNGSYNTQIDGCYSCHMVDYNSAANPPHSASGFSTVCEECHTQSEWVPSTFDHDAQYFPIYTGKHREKWNECSDCHNVQSNYSVFTCIDCHEHNQSDMDNDHAGVNGYVYTSNACFDCHPSGDGDDLAFNHAATNFPLEGAHVGIQCSSCHVSPDVLPGTLCIDCHVSEFDTATDPNHAELNFSQDCVECHSSDAGWLLTSFTIHDQFYPLTGGHAAVADNCSSCHESGYTNTPDQCAECHLETFNSAVNPDHQALQLSQNCDECHTTDPDWKPALFTVHDQYFPLLGAHSMVTDCADCHNGNYSTKFDGCYSCHETDYNSAANPPHSSAGFSTVCEDCHTQTAWVPSTFDHDVQYFPIYTGRHRQEWNECSDCHTVQSDYSIFSCIDCHEHNQSDTDSDHREVRNYEYNSLACLDCHPDGRNNDLLRMMKPIR